MRPAIAGAKIIQVKLDGFPDDAFEVLSFTATEAISTVPSYSITMASREPIHDFDALLEAKAQLSFGDPPVLIHGMLSSVQQGYDANFQAGVGKRTRVDIVLVPELWKLTLNYQTRFYRDMDVPDIIKDIMGRNGLTVEISCSGDHPKRKSVLQYQETDLDFIQRLCEHEGIHYQTIHGDSEERFVFADTNGAFETVPEESDLPLRNPKASEGKSNLGAWGEERTVTRFQSRQRTVPKKLILQDYNDQTPSKNLKVEGETPGKATNGTQYYFGEHYKNTNEGKALTDLRKEEIVARKRVYFGTSNSHRLYAGAVFKLSETTSIDAELGQEYVITEIQAEGGQPLEHTARGGGYHYANSFTCIPKSVVFRPPLLTAWPKVEGFHVAKVIASGDDYSDVEDQGRYHVQFLFDINNSGSIPIRKIEPYVGGNYGFHSPLHKGVEVYVAFENNDPDRPVIVSAVHNPDYPNTIKSGNHTQSVWRSGGNNEIKMEDTKGSELFFQHCEKDHQVKTENDKAEEVGHDEKLEVKNNRERKVGVDEKIEIGSNRKKKVGADETIEIVGNQEITVKGNLTETVKGNKKGTVEGNLDDSLTGDLTLAVKGKSTMKYTGDQSIKIDANSKYEVGGNSTVKITGAKDEKISGKSDLAVTGDVGQKLDGKLSVDAGGDVSQSSGGDFSLETKTGKLSGSGLQLELEGKVKAEVKSDVKLTLDGGSAIELKGKKVEMKADADMIVKGATIKLN